MKDVEWIRKKKFQIFQIFEIQTVFREFFRGKNENYKQIARDSDFE